MGNSSQKSQPTFCKMALDRQVFQAGNFVHGRLCIQVGDKDLKTFEKFAQGAVVDMQLIGEEKVWWNTKSSHTKTPKPGQNYRHLASGQDRRDNNKQLINIRHQIPLDKATLLGGTRSIEVPFRLPLPDDLPSSFIYAGEQ
jgi:hypothetical protein